MEWTSQRPNRAGCYLARFVSGYEFVVTVGDDGLCVFRGADTDATYHIRSAMWDRASWRTKPVAAHAAEVAHARA